jgi:hypothetical protein
MGFPDASLGTSPKASFLRISLVIVGLSLFFGVTYLGGIYRTSANALCIAVLIYTLVVIIQREQDLRSNALHPLSYLFLGLLVSYGLRAVLLEGMRLDIMFAGSSLEHLREGCILTTIAVVFYYWGYRYGGVARLARRMPLLGFPGERDRPYRLLRRGYFLYLVGLMAKLNLVSHGILHVSQGPLDLLFLRYKIVLDELSQFAALAYVAVAALALTRRVSPLWLAPLLVAEVYAGSLNGGGTLIFMPIVLAVIVFSYYVRRIRWSVMAASMALILLVVAPLAVMWKHAYFEELRLRRGTAGMEMVLMAAEQVARNPDIASVRMNVLGRHGELDILLTVLDRVPRIYPYQKGDTFIPYLLHAPIPRALWPSKPILDIGHRFSILFRDDPQKKLEKGTSISIGTVAELYYNFGYWGLLACPIFGMVVRFFWERWKHYFQVEACASIRLPFLLFSVAGFGADTAGLASDVLELIIVPVTLYIFMMAFYGRRPKVLRWRSAPSVP